MNAKKSYQQQKKCSLSPAKPSTSQPVFATNFLIVANCFNIFQLCTVKLINFCARFRRRDIFNFRALYLLCDALDNKRFVLLINRELDFNTN